MANILTLKKMTYFSILCHPTDISPRQRTNLRILVHRCLCDCESICQPYRLFECRIFLTTGHIWYFVLSFPRRYSLLPKQSLSKHFTKFNKFRLSDTYVNKYVNNVLFRLHVFYILHNAIYKISFFVLNAQRLSINIILYCTNSISNR